MQRSFQVLVACAANVCRSPLAANVLRSSLASLRPAVYVSWAGTYAAVGDAMCPQAASYVGLSGSIGDSRQVTQELLTQADLLLTADRTQRAWLARMDPSTRPRTFTLRQGARLAAWVAQHVRAGTVPAGAFAMPEGMLERLQWLATEMDAARGMLASWDPQHDDIPDNHSEDDHTETLAEVSNASRELAEAMIVIARAGLAGEPLVPMPETGNVLLAHEPYDIAQTPWQRVKSFMARDHLITTQATLSACVRTENLGHIGSSSPSFNEILMTPRTEITRHLKRALVHADVRNSKGFPASVVVSSARHGAGKTATAINLALSFVQAGVSVILLDADLRASKVGAYLGIESAIGLPDVLAGELSLDEALVRWHRGILTVLPCGVNVADAHALLTSQRMQELHEELLTRADIVLINAPPIAPGSDALALGSLSDGIVLVVGGGRTTCRQFKLAWDALEQSDSRVLGTVMTFAQV